MTIITLDDIKRHTRIDTDAEDELLTLYGDAAERTVQNYLQRDWAEMETLYRGTWLQPVRTATLMLVAHFYERREPVSNANMYSVPYTFDAILKPYMRLT